jgi:predicted nucleic acid-binding protein
MRGSVLWDSSATLALLDADDPNHLRARRTLERLQAEKRPGFVTNYVEVETHALLLRRLGRAAARQWLLRGGLPVLRASAEEEARGREIIARYEDKDWSLCDAISFAVMERRRVAAAFSFDHHFQQYGRIEVWGVPHPM